MTARPAFNYAAFLKGWRSLCADNAIDARTGEPLACSDQLWWQKNPAVWAEIGPNASPTEAAAFQSIAAQARRLAGAPEVGAETGYALRPSMQAEIAAMAVDGERRAVQMALPLRELYARRGETVEEILGQRMIVPINAA